MDMWEGIYSSIFDRVKDQSFKAWNDDMMWMWFYFTFGVWFCIFLATGPRIVVKAPKIKPENDQIEENSSMKKDQ